MGVFDILKWKQYKNDKESLERQTEEFGKQIAELEKQIAELKSKFTPEMMDAVKLLEFKEELNNQIEALNSTI